MTFHPLDNPVHLALESEQSAFGERNALAARYRADYSPLAALREPTEDALEALAKLTMPGGFASVITSNSQLPGAPVWRLDRVVPCRQMICQQLSIHDHTGQENFETLGCALGPEDAEAMLSLARLTEPGPFEKRTGEMGAYIGIKHERQLLAMAGERIKLPGWVEVSGVCTHPSSRGKGYARTLVAEMTKRVLAAGNQAFLHVVIGGPSESSAVRVYQSVGYVERSIVYLHVLSTRN